MFEWLGILLNMVLQDGERFNLAILALVCLQLAEQNFVRHLALISLPQHWHLNLSKGLVKSAFFRAAFLQTSEQYIVSH